jgi:hypothetical protein
MNKVIADKNDGFPLDFMIPPHSCGMSRLFWKVSMCNPEKFANVNSKSRLPPTQIINQYKRHAESNAAQPMAQSTNSVM